MDDSNNPNSTNSSPGGFNPAPIPPTPTPSDPANGFNDTLSANPWGASAPSQPSTPAQPTLNPWATPTSASPVPTPPSEPTPAFGQPTPPVSSAPVTDQFPSPNPQFPTSPAMPSPDPLASLNSTPSSSPNTPDPMMQPNTSPTNPSTDFNFPNSQPTDQLTSASTPTPTFPTNNPSPLDNPLNVPPESSNSFTPPSSQPTQPTWEPAGITPTQDQSLTQTSAPNIDMSIPAQSNPAPVEVSSAPTDLSHLISGAAPDNNPASNPPAAETLVVPPTQNPNPDVPTVPSEHKTAIPMWLIGVGVGLLILVIGASAYFILGVGQSNKTASSVPAEVTQQTSTVKTPPPVATQVPQATAPAASSSASFGALQGSTQTQATSAADLIKQRQAH